MNQYPDVTKYDCIYSQFDHMTVSESNGDLRFAIKFDHNPEAILFIGVAEARALRQQLKSYINSRFPYEA